MASELTKSVGDGDSSPVDMTVPRLLVLSTKSPFPPRQGDEVRLLGLLRAAATVGETTLAVWGGVARRSRAEGVAVQWLPVSSLVAMAGVIDQGIRGRPLAFGPYARGFPPVAGHWDLVIGFQLKTWRWAQSVRANIHVLDMVDALSWYAQSPEMPAAKRCQLRGIRREESVACQLFDQVWVSSKHDQQYLASTTGAEIQMVPNGPLKIDPLPAAKEGKRVLFVGNHTYPPNRQGIAWFLREIWPQLQREGFTLDLVGKGSEPFRKHVGVRVWGQVDEVEPFYAQAKCVISPVWWGGGSQSKIWEALGYGRRIVVQPEAAAGIGPIDGMVVASGREEWVVAIRDTANEVSPLGDFPPMVTTHMAQALRRVLSHAI